MAADLEVALIDPGFLVGKDNASVNVFVDDRSVNEMKVGQTNTFTLALSLPTRNPGSISATSKSADISLLP